MSALAEVLAREIAAAGPIPVARFMELALAHPEHGYYTTRDPLGAGGDFVTAPEVSQMFGELIGAWAAVTWEAMGRPRPFVLAELGPGRGTLMADALRAARARPDFAEAARLHLVETSPVLRARQATTLAAHGPRWHAGFEDLPAGPLILVANEFFDALPVRQFQRGARGWAERLVAAEADGAFRFALSAPLAADALPAGLPAGASAGTIAEVSPARDALADAVARRLARSGGAALIIDYGHAVAAAGETLQAVSRHRFADPLADPGAADLTAHVDFAALARAARAAGGAVCGPVSQGRFLRALGIAHRAASLAAGKDAATAEAIGAALRRLIAPSEMGNLFKVLALAHPGLAPLPGFEPETP